MAFPFILNLFCLVTIKSLSLQSKYLQIMIKIVISEEFTTVKDTVEQLQHIASLIEQGYEKGVSPEWELINTEDKEYQINEIKRIIGGYGGTTTIELELESSPCISYQSGGGIEQFILVEEFNLNTVTTVTYLDENELSYNELSYNELSDEIINEIFNIMLVYEINCRNTIGTNFNS